jgi:hypothetical protein
MTEQFMRVFAFPFAQLGGLIRWLSLHSAGGNIAAWVLYIALCLVPVGLVMGAARQRARRGTRLDIQFIFRAHDSLGGVLSILLFAVMYFNINPGALPQSLLIFPQVVGQIMLGVTVWSVILAWGVIAFAGRIQAASESALFRSMGMAAYALLVLFGAVVVQRLWGVPRLLQEGDAAARFFALLVGIAQILPPVMNVLIILAGIALIRAMSAGAAFSGDVTGKAQVLSRRAVWALGVTVLSGAGINILQLALAARLTDINVNIDLPLTEIFFALGALMLARFFAAAQSLSDENEGFI